MLIVNRKPAHPYLRPLVAVGLEDVSREVLELALRVLEPKVPPVPVVHAYWPPFEGFILPTLSEKELKEYHQELKKQAQACLERILEPFAKKGVRWKPLVGHGDPRRMVLWEAALRRSDLIVCGTHARSGLSHARLGSVAEWLISAARCDVLVARPARFSFELP
ncbi:MAG: universal stress protein [Acidobacteria bacterium]|nr:universal stress protein [Acidobacteriota bacterium]